MRTYIKSLSHTHAPPSHARTHAHTGPQTHTHTQTHTPGAPIGPLLPGRPGLPHKPVWSPQPVSLFRQLLVPSMSEQLGVVSPRLEVS